MDPWYKVVTPRKEVREGRSFNPDEFAIALEQVIAGTAPEDYTNPEKFFARTCFTRALREHAGMVLKRLTGETTNTAPVLTLITQFGGGKTHTLTALYHLAANGAKANKYAGVDSLLKTAGLSSVPEARTAVFVGNAWDPQKGRETPWIDIARSLAGDEGVAALGPAAKTTPPGTKAIGRMIEKAGGRVLVLFDEVLNFVNRHRKLAEPFHSFIQNLTVAMTGTTHSASVISLPRSQVEMTDWDIQWQERITKVVRRVAKDLIANDEAEIGEVVRRRLFENLGDERSRRRVAKTYADWCFERRAQLPPEWTAVDTATTESKAREFLRNRFENCYPFHPATLSVFQRKWQTLAQYQQTRGTLAMLAQWVSLAYRKEHEEARRGELLTLGSAPLHVSEFRSVILGQLGEPRLMAAIETDLAGGHSHARALDADTKGPLRDIHRRVGTAIFFESSGGQVEKVAHLPELRFALGGPQIDTTSIDNAALALEAKGFYTRKIGSDGFRINHKPTLKKVVNDRRASLDPEKEVEPAMEKLIKGEFDRGRSVPVLWFPSEGADVQDSPRLTLVVLSPKTEWDGKKALRQRIAEWTKQRGNSPRLYPASLVWCLKKPGRELREKVENWLAWQRVRREISEGTLGEDFDRAEISEIQARVRDEEEDAKDEVWASYRFVVLADNQESDGLKIIDLGAGHASASETLCGRVITALKSGGLLSESVGAGFIDRNWPPALKDSGAWPLSSLRQSFLNGTLTRLLDPDAVLKSKIVEFVEKGDFGLGSGQKPDGTYERLWFNELIAQDEVDFQQGVFLLKKKTADALKTKTDPQPGPGPSPEPELGEEPEPGPEPGPGGQTTTLRLVGSVPPEVWNRLGTKLLPKLRSGGAKLDVGVEFSVTLQTGLTPNLRAELRQLLDELGIGDRLRIEET
ncbi:MAG: DUF499 domain-containing protein [Acidobacteriota bacterium]